MKIGKELVTAAIAIVVLTVLLGVGYPLVMTGIAQVAFPNKADGSQIKADGKVVGSRLIAKAFVIDTGKKDSDGNPITKPDPKYFQPRPSQTRYSATSTSFSNRGPNSAVGRFFFRDALASYLDLERRYDPGLTSAGVPVDAVTTSASGVDPDISQANARIQAHRIAAVRRLALARVDRLIDDHTDGRFLGVIGEPGVNVLELNLALDKEPAR
jgi:potassium-transporting ATPase KdpC subunit